MWSVWCTNHPVVSYQDEEEVREEVFHQQLAVYMSKEYIHLLGMWLPSAAVTYTVALTHTEVACLVSPDGSVGKPRQPAEGCGDVMMVEENQAQDMASSQPYSSSFVLSSFATRMVQDQVRALQ